MLSKVWSKIKYWWVELSPEILRYAKIIMRIIGPALINVAGQAVIEAGKQKQLNGWERFDFAVDYTKTQAPNAAADAVVNAVRIAYTDWSGKLSEK